MNKKLTGMIGKTFLYLGHQYVIKGLDEVEEDLYEVKTDKRTMRMSSADLRKEFLPVHTNGKENLALVKTINESLAMKDLGVTLMETLDKVKANPKYIEQARAINETAKTMIELGKLQLEIIKTVREV